MMIYFLCAVSALFMTYIGSYWIDKLYEQSQEILSFPEDVIQRSKYRKFILLIAIFSLNVYFSNVSMPNCLYLIIASYFLLLITITDFEQYLIFDKMIIPFTIVGFIAIYHLDLIWNIHLGTALFCGGTFLMIASITHGALGGGDVKLIASLGIWLGYPRLSHVIIAGCILAGVVAVILIVTKIKNRHSMFAYGPYFTLTAIFDMCRYSSLN